MQYGQIMFRNSLTTTSLQSKMWLSDSTVKQTFFRGKMKKH